MLIGRRRLEPDRKSASTHGGCRGQMINHTSPEKFEGESCAGKSLWIAL
jgi:hypothetical protein